MYIEVEILDNITLEKFYETMPKYQFEYHVNISLKNSYVYFEVPKAACSTIKTTLQEIDAKSFGSHIPEKKTEVIHNKNDSPLLSPKDIGFEKFKELLIDKNIFKFSFVRNPFDKVLSAYLNKIKNYAGKEKKEITDILGIDIHEEIGFDQFIYAIEKTTPYNMNPHWRPQTNQLFYDLVKYDFIGRLENFDKDFQMVLNKINPEFEFKSNNYSDKTDAKEKLQQFYTQKTIEIVKKIYKQDFENFNYPYTLSKK